jgi:hypothetical protein
MVQQINWQCIAMHDTAKRRGLWYAEGSGVIYLRAGREGDDASSVIRKSAVGDREYKEFLNVLETARYAIEMSGEDEELCDIKPSTCWDEKGEQPMNHNGTIRDVNGTPYIVWKPDTLYEPFRDMAGLMHELEMETMNNVWESPSWGSKWRTETYRMKLEDFERITGEKVMTKQTEKTEQPEYPVNEWFTADGETVPLRDKFFLLFRSPGEGAYVMYANFPTLDGTEFCYIPIPEKQVKPLQGIGLDEPQVYESDLTGDWVCRSCSSCKRGIWVIKAEHPDKETAIEIHNAAIEVRNRAVGKVEEK